MTVLPLASASEPAVVVRHAAVARRLRLTVSGLRGQPHVANRLEAELRSPDLGVEEVRADWRSGRLLLRYRADAPLLERLRELPDRPESGTRSFRWRGRTQASPQAPWHSLATDEVVERLEGSRDGLTPAEARRRLRLYGPNALAEIEPRSRLALLASQLANVPSALLIGSSGLAIMVRDFLDAGAILSAVGLDAAIGFGVERQNEMTLASWHRLEAGQARVIRGAAIEKVQAHELTVGDVIVVRGGDTIPADARLLDVHRFSSNEAILTGESEPRVKGTGPVAEDAPLAERTCMLFSGTTAVSGRARAVVTGIGEATEVARIRELLDEEEAPRTPFEQRLDKLTRDLSAAGAASGIAAAGLSLMRLRSPRQALGNAVALAVAAIPEGLPVVSTSALLHSMKRLRERGMLVRRLVSAETLGGVSVICADKTGTLTLNDMQLELLDLGHGAIAAEDVRANPEKLFEDPTTLILAAASLNADVEVQGDHGRLTLSGSATEKALVEAADAAGLDRAALWRDYPRRLLRERDRGAHFVVSLHDAPDGNALAFLKGAPEQVVHLCERDAAGPLDEKARERLLARNEAMAAEGLRVLAVGWRRLERGQREGLERGHTLLGLLGLRDPLRPGAARIVRGAARAHIRTVILTGDQRRTAEAVASALGLAGEVLDGAELAALLRGSGPETHARLRKIAAVARIDPADKAAFVRALREAGEIVAMAGDGVNDAPAIRAADVGIAIGSRASDVSREAADIVLADEDMGSILHAVGEGRLVQDNLRRAVRFLLATNFSEAALALGAVAVGARDPFTPLRLLWLNLISDSVPALALALEPADGDVLARPPAPPETPLVSPETRRDVVRDGLAMAGFGALWQAAAGPAVGFSALAGAQLAYTLGCRAPTSPPSNRFRTLLGGTVALHLGAMAFPPVRALLRLPPALSPLELVAFGTGFLRPWAAPRSVSQMIVVRRGRAKEESR